jgi:hypothetical protein
MSVIVCHKQMGGQVSADGCRATLPLRPNSSESKKSLVFFQSINFLCVFVSHVLSKRFQGQQLRHPAVGYYEDFQNLWEIAEEAKNISQL